MRLPMMAAASITRTELSLDRSRANSASYSVSGTPTMVAASDGWSLSLATTSSM